MARLLSLSPSSDFTTLGTSPAGNIEIPLPVPQRLTGVAVFPAPLCNLRWRQWKEKGAGSTSKDGGRRERRGRRPGDL